MTIYRTSSFLRATAKAARAKPKKSVRNLSGAKKGRCWRGRKGPRKNLVVMNNDQENARLQGYLKSLDQDGLEEVLNEVLEEIRRRETEQMKKDVLTHSQKLRLRRDFK